MHFMYLQFTMIYKLLWVAVVTEVLASDSALHPVCALNPLNPKFAITPLSMALNYQLA